MSGAVETIRPAAGAGVTCIGFTPFGTGTLRGFGGFHVVGWRLRVLGCSCHRQNESRWVGLPGKPLVDKAGVALRDDNGKIRYRRFSPSTIARSCAASAMPPVRRWTATRPGGTDERPRHTALALAHASLAVVPLWWPVEKNGRRVCACGKADCRSPGKHPIGQLGGRTGQRSRRTASTRPHR